ncbi:MAG: hypothetical protein ABIX10_00375 [Acidimicrobiales bacterium]
MSLYRTADLPTSGDDGTGDATPVAEVVFRFERQGVYRAEIIVDEPGSYQLVSLNIWNVERGDFPDPIALNVVTPTEPDVPGAERPWYPIGLAVIATSGLVVWSGRRFQARA